MLLGMKPACGQQFREVDFQGVGPLDDYGDEVMKVYNV